MTELERESSHERLDAELTLMWRRLRRMAVALSREVEDGLDPPAYGLLGTIYDAPGDVRGADLAEKFGLDKSTVSRQIAQLESLGLLQRVPDPQDGRARLVRATEAGGERVRRFRRRRISWLSHALQSWSDDDVEQLAGMLDRLNSDLGCPDR